MKYSRNQRPSRDELVSLYDTLTLNEIAQKYSTTRTRIKRWFDYYNIPINTRGGGNNRRVLNSLSIEDFKEWINSNTPRSVIAERLKCSESNVTRLMKSFGLIRYYRKSEYDKYSRRVRMLTEKAYVEHIDIINPKRLPRTICGVEGGYQLDHIRSVRECFDLNISEEECAGVNNLQMLTWQNNLAKRRF